MCYFLFLLPGMLKSHLIKYNETCVKTSQIISSWRILPQKLKKLPLFPVNGEVDIFT